MILFPIALTDESEHLDSDSCGTFRGRWHYSDAHGRYEGNPVLSVDVEDTVASIRHKINAAGNQRTHSGAMKKEYMDSMLTWTASKCSLDTAFNYLRFLMTGLGSPPAEGALDKETWKSIMRNVEHITFRAVAFTIWTRYIHESRFTCGVSDLLPGTSSW